MKLILSLLCMSLATGAMAGQIYRWVDEKGVTQFSDQPPPTKHRKVETVKAKGNVVEVDKSSYSMRQAASQSPVVVFTSTDCGLPCSQGQDFLRQRGIPFTTKAPDRVKADADELKGLVGVLEVPVIKVGKAHYKGFDSDAWQGLLTAAGYPKETVPGAKAPAPSAEAPASKPADEGKTPAAAQPGSKPKP